MDSVSQSVKLVDGHCSTDLALRKKDCLFPNNHCVTVQRAQLLKKEFKRNPHLH